MKTDSLIDLLARNAGPAPRAVALRRLLPATLAGMAASAVLAIAWLGLIPNELFHQPAPWVKLGYAAALMASAGWLTGRLARPAAPVDAAVRAVAGVAAVMAALGLLAWWFTPEAARLPGLRGHSWYECPFNVLALSLPALAGSLWALRGLAPTRPRAAGAAAGLLAGAAGAFGYALACTEMAVPFIAVWYTLGIALTAALGAWLGPRVLRW